MANVTFAVRGDSLNARFSKGGKTPGIFTATTAPSVVPASHAGLLGTAYIDLYQSNASRRALVYPGGKNFSTNPGISVLIRCAFQDNASLQGIWQIGGPWQSITPHQMYLFYVSNEIRIAIFDERGVPLGNGFGTPLENYTIGFFTPVVGQYHDIVVMSTGIGSSNGYNVYIDGNFIGQAGLGASIQNPRDLGLMTHIALGAVASDVNVPYTYVNEFVIFDGVVDPLNVALESGNGALSGVGRSSFVAAAAFDGQETVDPGVSNVRPGTNYEINGVAKVGALVLPVSTDPGVGNVLLGTAYEINDVPKVGTLISADQANVGDVRKGVKYNAETLTGTYDIFSAATTANLGAAASALEGLTTWLRTNIPGLTVLSEWPYANQKLTYPSITVTDGQAKRMPLMPETIHVTDPDVDNKVVATEIVAEYDDIWQIDLWARNKLERDELVKQIIDAFNSMEVDNTGNNNPDGISLTLANYFNVIARYEIQDHQSVDDEAGAQRQERREKFRILVNFREVKLRTYYAMRTIEQHVGVTDQNENLEDMPDSEIESHD